MATTAPVITLREDAISWTPTDDGLIVILDLRTSRYLNLNSAAVTLWMRLTQGATEQELIATLHEKFHLAEEIATADVTAFLAALRDRDLVQERPD